MRRRWRRCSSSRDRAQRVPRAGRARFSATSRSWSRPSLRWRARRGPGGGMGFTGARVTDRSERCRQFRIRIRRRWRRRVEGLRRARRCASRTSCRPSSRIRLRYPSRSRTRFRGGWAWSPVRMPSNRPASRSARKNTRSNSRPTRASSPSRRRTCVRRARSRGPPGKDRSARRLRVTSRSRTPPTRRASRFSRRSYPSSSLRGAFGRSRAQTTIPTRRRRRSRCSRWRAEAAGRGATTSRSSSWSVRSRRCSSSLTNSVTARGGERGRGIETLGRAATPTGGKPFPSRPPAISP
jgi:hypothetical protein